MIKLKLALNGIKKRKLKCFLVFFTIMVTVIVMIVSASFNSCVVKTRLKQFRYSTLNSQIFIYSKSQSAYDRFFDKDVMDKLKDADNVQSIMESCAYTVENMQNNEQLYIYGVDIQKANKNYPFSVYSGDMNFKEDNGVIISRNLAAKNGLKLNSTISVRTDNGNHEFKVKCISNNDGFFSNNQIVILCNILEAQKAINVGNKINGIDVTIEDLEKVEDTTKELSNIVKDTNLEATERYQKSDYNSFVTTVVLALKIFSIFSVIISLYILYSLFKASIYENISEMATLRSIGFTIRGYRVVVLLQSIIIFIAAVLFGIVLSYPCITALLSFFVNGESVISYNYIYISIDILVLFIFSILSVYYSINRIIKQPLTVLLNKGKNNYIKKSKTFFTSITGLIFILVAFILYFYIADKAGANCYFISLILFVLGFILLTSIIAKGLTIVVEKIFGKAVKTLGIVVKQLKFNIESYTESIVVVCLVVLISTITFTTSSTLENSMKSVYNGMDIMVTVNDEGSYEKVSNIISDAGYNESTIQKRYNDQLNNKDVIVSGIDIDSYIHTKCETVIGGSRKEIFTKLKQHNTAIVTNTFMKNNNLKVNDIIELSNNRLRIVGVVSSFENMGKIIFISQDTYGSIYGDDKGQIVALISTYDVDSCYQQLSDSGKKFENYSINKISEMCESNIKQNKIIINMIYALCLIMLIVSIIGFITNVIVNVLSRIHDYIIYRTLGVSRKQIIRIAVIESVVVGLYSTILGTLMGIVLNPIAIKLISYYVGDMALKVNIVTLIVFDIVICMLIILSTIYVFKKHVLKPKLIQNLKQT